MHLLLSAAQANLNTLALSAEKICLRLFCAMIVGMVIGTEREFTNRPAGMRTHILVSLGACAVMITGQMIFLQYHALGGSPDPSRLSAQVITGVGFLGAGTILREGANVKGLTTAASLWAVACLGIAAGCGYYTVALAGMVFILSTLTIFEVFQHKLMGPQCTLHFYTAEVTDISAGLVAINSFAQKYRAGIHDMLAQQLPDTSYRITFQVEIGGLLSKKRRLKFYGSLLADHSINSLRICDETDTVVS